MKKKITISSNYNNTLKKLLVLIKKNKAEAISSVNIILIQTYWEIGKEILEKLSYDGKQEFPGKKVFLLQI